jgi:predicted amidohydrolase YtcJ
MTRPAALRATLAAASLIACTPSLSNAQAAAADLIVTNARIYTVDAGRPRAEALAVKDGRIVFVGASQPAMALKGTATRVVDVGGRTIIPGMTDAHGHVLGLGLALRWVDLVGTKSYDEVIRRVIERAKTTPKGQWILGRGWDQNQWGDTRFPTAEALSKALPDHPVMLERVDGHAVLANAKAMALAGVTAQTADPVGGRLERDAQGAPTGVFVDNAQPIVATKVPELSSAEVRDAIVASVKELNRWGLTGVHDAGSSLGTIDAYEALGKAGQLDIRLYAMIGDDAAALKKYFAIGPRSGLFDGRLWVRSVKLYADGALGSRGAALLDPYNDDAKNTGLLVSTLAHIKDVSVQALRAGFQVGTHAIGDRGNRNVLDAYAQAFAEVPVADPRFRVEHAQIVNFADFPRFAAMGVIPSMQASHQTSDMYWAEQRIGSSRAPGAYAWRTFLDQGSIIPNGSDFPVEHPNPLISFHAAIARQDANDWPAGGWHPEQRMTREEALKSMTLWPAVAAFQENELGSITPGKRADFVVLSQDIMTIGAGDILRTRVLSTWIGGKAVYEAK